jgi:hypothetical protein
MEMARYTGSPMFSPGDGSMFRVTVAFTVLTPEKGFPNRLTDASRALNTRMAHNLKGDLGKEVTDESHF